MNQEVEKNSRVRILPGVKSEYGEKFVDKEGEVLATFPPNSSQSQRVMVRFEGGLIVNFRKEDVIEIEIPGKDESTT